MFKETTKMSMRIPFKVSARTARLIGRENVATSKGAIIELIKNCYDADSRFSIVLIDNRYGVYHDKLSISDYEHLVAIGVSQELLDSISSQSSGDTYPVKDRSDKQSHCYPYLACTKCIYRSGKSHQKPSAHVGCLGG